MRSFVKDIADLDPQEYKNQVFITPVHGQPSVYWKSCLNELTKKYEWKKI